MPTFQPLSIELTYVPEIASPANPTEDELVCLAEYILASERAAGPWAVAVVLVSDDRLRTLHRDYMGIDEETDVMTFPLGDAAVSGGDIVISADRAADQATDAGHSLADEIRFLVAHGLLHLSGWDDRDATERTRMLDRQTELLAAFSHQDAG